MYIGVLGPLEVCDGSRDLTPTAAKLRVVLAMLAMFANRVVSTSALIEELWGTDPPPSAATTLQTYIYQLRKRMGHPGAGAADASLIATRGPGYLVRIDPEGLDA